MYARHKKGCPHSANAYDPVKYDVLHSQSVGNIHHHKERHTHTDAEQGYVRSIEKRYHEHCAEVVYNGKSGKKNLYRQRDTVAKHIKYGKRERDVRSHRYPPPSRHVTVRIEQIIDECRHNHPEHRRPYRKYRVAHIGKFPSDELSFKFQTYNKEKHRHQTVVYPMVQIEIEITGTVEQKAELLLKEVKITVAQRRVSQYKRNDNAYAEHYAARFLLIHKMLQRHDKPVT